MGKYKITISDNAKQDIIDLSNTIRFEYKSPITAFRYLKGLYIEINRLQTTAETFSIQTRQSLIQYGFNVRRLNYKKMTIIYTVTDNTVCIHRVVPASTIAGL